MYLLFKLGLLILTIRVTCEFYLEDVTAIAIVGLVTVLILTADLVNTILGND